MRTRLLAISLSALGACTASGDQVQPKKDEIFFPTGAAVAPNEKVLFVANANSELLYDSGAVWVVDLEKVDSVADAWIASKTVPPDCADSSGRGGPDTDHTETLECDESGYLRTEAGVRIGNFATEIAVQDTHDNTARLIVPTRGDPSVAWVDYKNDVLSCSQSTEGVPLCDDAHRLSFVRNDSALKSLPDEPFSAYADSTGEFAMVTHLTSGSVTLIDSHPNSDAIIADVVDNVFAADPATGLRGSTGVTGKQSGGGSLAYVGSNSEDRIQTFSVGRPVNGASPYLLAGDYFFLDGVGNNAGGSIDTRGMAFSPSGDRMYLVNRRPPSLQIIDTSVDATGFPSNKTIGGTDICREASTLAVMDAGAGERIYVTCFQDGQLYVIDPRGTGSVEDIITVGRGPYSVAVSPSRKKLYVTNFLEDTIAVVDVRPGVPTQNRVVLRIGIPRDL